MSRFILVLVLCMGILPLLAQEINFNLGGAGARAAGMGEAFIGVADDATAVSWNPGGLYSLERPEASVVARFVSLENEESFAMYKHTYNCDHFNLNFISAAYPFPIGEKKLVLALARQRQIDLAVKMDYDDGFEERSGGADTYTLGIGSHSGIIGYGLSANIWSSKSDYEQNGMDSYGYKNTVESSFSGFNMVLGAMFDFNKSAEPKPYKLGVVVKTPFTLTADQTDKTIYEGETYKDTYTTEVDMPLMLGFGGSMRIGEFFTLAVDFESRLFADAESKTTGSSYEDTNTTEKYSKDNLNQFRLGAEYLMVKDWGVIPLRIGFQSYPTTLNNLKDADNDGETDTVGDQVVGGAFSLGSGLIFNRCAIDLAWSGTSFERTIDTSGNQVKWAKFMSTLTMSAIVYF